MLDEGTAALDEANALKIEQKLINDPTLGVIIITHNLWNSIKELLDGIYVVESYSDN